MELHLLVHSLTSEQLHLPCFLYSSKSIIIYDVVLWVWFCAKRRSCVAVDSRALSLSRAVFWSFIVNMNVYLFAYYSSCIV